MDTTTINGRGVTAPDNPKARRTRALFDALRADDRSVVARRALEGAITDAGLRLGDPRLAGCLAALDDLGTDELDYDAFERVVAKNALMLEKVVQGLTILPDFAGFAAEVESIFEATRAADTGRVADYIPQLGRVDPERYAAALCTVDGQRLALGDAAVDFSLQSCFKPIGYCLALEEHGHETVHRHVGCEPSGHSFNDLSFDRNGLPHNPMINAGAIMSCSMIRPTHASADRFDYFMSVWRDLMGGAKPGFSNPTYLSERDTADRNFALGYSMRENGAFPDGTDLLETLEFYFQSCSLEVTADAMSVAAATLANGGICPTTGKRVFRADTVQKCLSLMSSCGMYDFSGEWAFSIGLPAKSGVGGGIWVVIPNVLGLCVWSPRLDENGNSVRGIAFCRRLVEAFRFHNYDSLIDGEARKNDPRRLDATQRDDVGDLCWAASQGDLTGMQRLIARGIAPDRADYDGRTPLHLAASEGHAAIVDYLVGRGVSASPTDRWGNTPLDDATREGHDEAARALINAGGVRGGEATA